MMAVEELAEAVPLTRVCEALGVPRSSVYRERKGPQPKAQPRARSAPARALSESERAEVRDTLNSEEYADQPPRAVWASLLDEGKYLCHWRTMYRILEEHGEVRERRRCPGSVWSLEPNRLWSFDANRGVVH